MMMYVPARTYPESASLPQAPSCWKGKKAEKFREAGEATVPWSSKSAEDKLTVEELVCDLTSRIQDCDSFVLLSPHDQGTLKVPINAAGCILLLEHAK